MRNYAAITGRNATVLCPASAGPQYYTYPQPAQRANSKFGNVLDYLPPWRLALRKISEN